MTDLKATLWLLCHDGELSSAAAVQLVNSRGKEQFGRVAATAHQTRDVSPDFRKFQVVRFRRRRLPQMKL